MAKKKHSYTQDQAQAVKKLLDKLEEKSPEHKSVLSGRELIQVVAPSIKTALEKGYSYADISAMLKEQGVDLSAASIGAYVRSLGGEVKKPRKRAQKPKPEIRMEEVAEDRPIQEQDDEKDTSGDRPKDPSFLSSKDV